MLNKYGHTVSTSKLQEIEIAVGELRQLEGAEHIPSNIINHVPVMFVFDNNDFQEETPSGRDTKWQRHQVAKALLNGGHHPFSDMLHSHLATIHLLYA